MDIQNTHDIVDVEVISETVRGDGSLGELFKNHYHPDVASVDEVVASDVVVLNNIGGLAMDGGLSSHGVDINAMLNQKLAEKGIDPNADIVDAVLVKKPDITVKIAGNSYFYPPGSVFIGVGVIQKRYEAWLDRLVKETFDNLTLTTKENGDYHPKYVKAYRLIQSLIYMANAEDEHENVIYAYEGPRLTKDLDIAAAVSKLVKAKKDVLKALTPYYLPEHAKPVEKKSAVEVDSKSTADEAVEV